MSTIRVELRKDGEVTKAFTGEYGIWGYVSRIGVGSDVYTYSSNDSNSSQIVFVLFTEGICHVNSLNDLESVKKEDIL